ncbi:MAG: NUDIX hydrolase [Oscillospiraceae bacterium]|nr:NUDIX hydrolase [Oscillospiraceae bacterium]
MDILFHTAKQVFSYRVAGICVKDGRVLLQKPVGDTAFAFPGGHAEFGETNAETLMREFREELGAEISVGALKWVGEIFFPWGDKPCHQLCLYYLVDITDAFTPQSGMFYGSEQLENDRFKLEFHWVTIEKLADIELYPTNAAALMQQLNGDVQHFIYRE